MTKVVSRRVLGKWIAATGVAASLRSALGQPSAEQTTKKRVSSQNAWTEMGPGIWKTTIGTPEKVTPVKSRLVPMKEPSSRLKKAEDCPLPTPHFAIRMRGVEIALPLAAHEEIFGFGLQMFSLAQRGKKKTLRVNADPRADTGDSHAPVPFYVTTRGYGVFVDTARYATFYCGESRPKPNAQTVNQDNDSQWISTENLELGQASEMLVEVPNCTGVDVYVFAGPTMLDAVRRYNMFSGGGVLPPEWGLGFFYRTAAKAIDREALAIAIEFRERHIPCDVIGLEPGWQSHAYPCTFVWQESRFPNPSSFIEKMKALNLRVNLWEHAFTDPASPLFRPLEDHAGDRGVWGGLVPDFQDAAARRIFGEYHAKHFLDIGVSGFKLDECDNSDYTGGWSFAELSEFPSGVDGEQMHSLFGLRYQKAIWQQFEDRQQPTYSLVRSSGALASSYPFVLYSDLYDHRQFIRALVNAGFSGLLWCPEVRDAAGDEDFIRRLQSVVFSPLAMVNGWYIPNPPWKQLDRTENNAGQLTPGWEALEARCREIIGWRMQLIPYLQAAFARYAQDGTPPFRALILDWPEIPEFTKVDDAWMVGDRVLVAPLFAGESSRVLMLPPGDWHDFWTGERHVGGTVLEIPANVRNIPVFAKGDSVLPLASITDATADAKRRELNVHVYGKGSLPFELELPSGESLVCNWNEVTGRGEVKSSGWDTPFKVLVWKQHS